jgi:hypothetical protein
MVGYKKAMKKNLTNSSRWTPDEMGMWLEVAHPNAIQRAMIVIYDRQTQDEKIHEMTNVDNRVGFSAADARLGSYFAKWVKAGNPLTGRHLDRARRMAVKYRKQLAEIANAKEINRQEDERERHKDAMVG